MAPNSKKESNVATANLATAYPTQPSLKNLTTTSWAPPASRANPALRSLGAAHVESFNYAMGDGLKRAVADLPQLEFDTKAENGVRVRLRVDECVVTSPAVPDAAVGVKDKRVFPTEARQAGTAYKGECWITLSYWINGERQAPLKRSLGQLPIMVMSDLCNLAGATPEELVRRGEQETEWGGYFILGGHERLIR